jgi:uroporphyrinogen-III decarboxylase
MTKRDQFIQYVRHGGPQPLCSPVQPFLDLGFYNEMGLDLFETLSPPPVGNVQSLAEAMTQLDPAICTRGNLGLDVLLNGTPEDVRRGTETILRETAGRKHLVAAGDYLFYATPEANVAAMAETVARQ